MEIPFALKASDGKTIFGTRNTKDNESVSDTAVIFVHGLAAKPSSHNFHGAAHTYPAEGVDTIRFSLYDDKDEARKLHECTLDTHASDLHVVLNHFRDTYTTIALVGHSLGCPAILQSSSELADIIILWEPAHLTKSLGTDFPKVEFEGSIYTVLPGGVGYLLNTEMLEQLKRFNINDELQMIAALKKLLLIIAAKGSRLEQGAQIYFDTALDPKQFISIEGTNHSFDEEGKEEELLNHTLAWIKKHRH